MNTYVILVLPIIWVVVACIVSLILYRTSESFFEDVQEHNGNTRRIRLVGSSVIAAIIYIGLAKYTPVDAITDISNNRMKISRNDLNQLNETISNLSNEILLMQGEPQVTQNHEGQELLTRISSKVSRVEEALKDVYKNSGDIVK
jgi:predicted nuclease with TOPRIM domain